ncbi:hypothetical protein B0H63DRAFT_163525 [Podospora didyma]|uniref:Uncharacterized protein n=1 Tax=Podospora didyma TaxID=330526 RepID=A0AAE0NTZ1_9PEZI|nr:hypothetical protein B0H63DRAFT_163525 [Podospora didyma]
MPSRWQQVPWPGGGLAHQQQQHFEQQQQQQQQHESRAPQSRFVEGSMNDRVSAAPPIDFLDLHEAQAYERQFYQADRAPAQQQSRQRRPMSSAGAAPAVRKGNFLGPLWDGVRERLHLTRSKSSGSIRRVNSKENKAVSASTPVAANGDERNASAATAATAAAAAATAGIYPTKEEVMESYKSLVASGFFENHAIQGTRHPLRTTNKGAHPSIASTNGAAPTGAGTASMSFAQHMAAQQQKPVQTFSSVPYSATRPSRAEDYPSVAPPPARQVVSENSDALSSPLRGTKRPSDVANEGETTARKLVKKLRHSASRISADPSMSQAASNTNTSTWASSRPSTSSNAPASAASSIFRGVTVTSGPVPEGGRLIRTPTKLTKSRFGGGRRLLGLGGRNSKESPTREQHPISPQDHDEDAMMIDSLPPPPPPAKSFHYPQRLRTRPSANNVPEPLSVVPDPNRGIPVVPQIPVAFYYHDGGDKKLQPVVKGKARMVMVGQNKGLNHSNRDSGLGGAEDVENCHRAW